jgi:hypothetical protein
MKRQREDQQCLEGMTRTGIRAMAEIACTQRDAERGGEVAFAGQESRKGSTAPGK